LLLVDNNAALIPGTTTSVLVSFNICPARVSLYLKDIVRGEHRYLI